MIGRTALSLAAAVVVAVGVSAAPLTAQDLAGAWLFSVDLDAGSGEATFVFEVDGDSITGTYAGLFGEQSVTGTIEGDVVRFSFESPDAQGTVSFEGVIEGDTIEGECVYGAVGAGTFSGSRIE